MPEPEGRRRLAQRGTARGSGQRNEQRVALNERPVESERVGRIRTVVARGFTWFEDVVYIVLGLLLSAGALVLLAGAGRGLWADVASGTALIDTVVHLLDRLLLVLMIVEVLYTVQLSFREHALVPEPFLIIGLVAVVRRILVITAEFPGMQDKGVEIIKIAMAELALLTVMVVALVGSLLMLKGRGARVAATRAS